ncbi:MAG: hypothetical protein IPP63_01425 [Chloracidobacterium sp.]|nr:hypothetical protein [Chloracidobacterium sp.]
MQRPFGHQHHVRSREKWRIPNVEYEIATVAVSDQEKRAGLAENGRAIFEAVLLAQRKNGTICDCKCPGGNGLQADCVCKNGTIYGTNFGTVEAVAMPNVHLRNIECRTQIAPIRMDRNTRIPGIVL